jgi:hypothetical protein
MYRQLIFLAFVAACGHGAKAGIDYDSSSPALPFFFGVAAPLRDAPAGKVIGEADCTSQLFVQERKAGSTLVAAGDKTAWIDDADLTAKPDRCTGPLYVHDARVSEKRAAATRPPVLEAADADGPGSLPKSFFRIRFDDEGARACVEAKVQSESLVEGAEGSGARDRITWGLQVDDDGRALTLTGPTEEKLDAAGVVDEKSRKHWLCLAEVKVVRRTNDVWLVVNGWGFRGRPSAFSPAAADRWFTTKAACEKAIGPGPRAKAISRHGCA